MPSLSPGAPWYRRLHWQVLLSLLLGVAFGLAAVNLGWQEWARDWIAPFGTVFMSLLKFVALPMVVFSVINGIASIGDPRQISRLGGRALLWFLGSALVAIGTGLVFVTLLRPGDVLPQATSAQLLEAYAGDASLREASAGGMRTSGPLRFLVEAVPDNLLGAVGNNARMLQVVVAAVMIGWTLLLMPREQARPLLSLCESAGGLFTRLAHGVAMLSPVGVFALITATIVAISGEDPSQALRLLEALAFYVATVVAALAFHQFATYSLVIRFVVGRSPREFFKGIAPAQLLCFSTSSTSATLPVTIECCEKNLGVPPRIARFVVPLGTTVNMDGSSLFQAVAAVFIAQALGVELAAADYALLVGTCLVAGIGTAPVPGSGLVMLAMVLSALEIPVEGLALIIGVDRIVNMCRATVNAIGDSVVAVLLARFGDEDDEEEEGEGEAA